MVTPILFRGFLRVVNGRVLMSTACTSQRAQPFWSAGTETQAAIITRAPQWCGVLWKHRSCSGFSLSITASNVNLLIALSAFSWILLKPHTSLFSVAELTSNCSSEPAQQAAPAREPAVVSLLPTVIIAPKECMNGKEQWWNR